MNLFSNFFKEGSLKNNFIWSFVGNFFLLGCQWLILLVLARFGTPTILGKYALAIGIVAPIVALCDMQLTQIQITDIENKYSLKDYFFYRIIALLVFFCVLVVITFINSNEDKTLVLLLFLARAFASLGEVIFGYYQSIEKFKVLSIIKIYRGLGGLLSIFIPLYFNLNLISTVICYVIVSIIIFLFVEFRSISGKIKSDRFSGFIGFKGLFKLSFPLGLSNGLNSLTANIPKYFLNFYFGKDVVGYFSVVSSPITWLALIPGVMSQVIIPRAAQNFQKGHIAEYLIIFLKYTVMITFFLSLSAISIHFYGKELLSLLYGYEYGQFSWLLEVLAISILIASLGCIGPYTIITSKSFWIQFSASVLSLLTMLLGCIVYLKVNNWTVIGYIELTREMTVILFYLLATYLIIKKKQAFS